jgi:two-component system sensor histidine kinase AlgZ
VPLEEELDLCERYLRIEGLRLGERLKLDWQIADMNERVLIPLLTLQPLLENAIYHGIQPLAEGGTIRVRVDFDNDRVNVRIVNPLPSPARQAENGNRMALVNIRSRLSVLYGNNAALQARAENGEFVTELTFPKTPEV